MEVEQNVGGFDGQNESNDGECSSPNYVVLPKAEYLGLLESLEPFQRRSMDVASKCINLLEAYGLDSPPAARLTPVVGHTTPQAQKRPSSPSTPVSASKRPRCVSSTSTAGEPSSPSRSRPKRSSVPTLSNSPRKRLPNHRDRIRDHIRQLLFPEGDGNEQVPWGGLAEWLLQHKKRLVNWPCGVPLPHHSLSLHQYNVRQSEHICNVGIENIEGR